MHDRYFVSSPICGDRALLSGGEAHHLIHVMRAKPGDEVILFDGTGGEFPAAITVLGRANVELVVGRRRDIDREAQRKVTLGVALPKGDRQRWLVEKSVELGIARLVPLKSERSAICPSASAATRLQRAVIEASKQCRRNRLLEIAPAMDWPEFIQNASTAARRLVAHPNKELTCQPPLARTDHLEIVLAIGPEGGWTDVELAQAVASGWETVDLGPRILRTETAALALAAYWLLEPQQG